MAGTTTPISFITGSDAGAGHLGRLDTWQGWHAVLFDFGTDGGAVDEGRYKELGEPGPILWVCRWPKEALWA